LSTAGRPDDASLVAEVSPLKEEGATVGQLADRLGYRSEAAFSRAFKRIIGVSPGAIRRSAGDQDRALIATPAG
jgi:AraC-like DNA-binding protein